MASLVEYDPVMSSDDERIALNQVVHALDEGRYEQGVRLVGPAGEDIALPKSLREVIRQCASYLARNQPITIVPLTHELTTQQAADILSVSRPYLIEQLLETGKLPYTKTGTHRRIAFADVVEYKRHRDAERHERVRRMAQAGQEFGLGPE